MTTSDHTAKSWRILKERMQFPRQSNMCLTGKGIRIVVLDSGRPPFSQPNRDRNFTTDSNCIDQLGHGTKMHSILKAPHGLSPEVEITHYKVFTKNSGFSIEGIRQALTVILKSKEPPDFLLMAFQDGNIYQNPGQLPANYRSISDLLNLISEQHIVIISSAGNQYAQGTGMSFPAIDSSCLSVTAQRIVANEMIQYLPANYLQGTRWDTDLAVPGVHIQTQSLANEGITISGTSAAATIAISALAVAKQFYNQIKTTKKQKFDLAFVKRMLLKDLQSGKKVPGCDLSGWITFIENEIQSNYETSNIYQTC